MMSNMIFSSADELQVVMIDGERAEGEKNFFSFNVFIHEHTGNQNIY